MFTPQQIDQISFSKATFGGYDMQQVDEFLEPLTEDYVTLYKENALLKSKMRVLVGKLEEYRKNEASVKEAAGNIQKYKERIMKETEAKCAAMIAEAKAAAEAVPAAAPAAAAADNSALVDAENERLAEARKMANSRISEIQDQMRSCIQALDRIKNSSASVPAEPAETAAAPAVGSDPVANEIAKNLEAIVGTTEEAAPAAAPRHPSNESTTSRFTNLNLQFGRNYDPMHK